LVTPWGPGKIGRKKAGLHGGGGRLWPDGAKWGPGKVGGLEFLLKRGQGNPRGRI